MPRDCFLLSEIVQSQLSFPLCLQKGPSTSRVSPGSRGSVSEVSAVEGRHRASPSYTPSTIRPKSAEPQIRVCLRFPQLVSQKLRFHRDCVCRNTLGLEAQSCAPAAAVRGLAEPVAGCSLRSLSHQRTGWSVLTALLMSSENTLCPSLWRVTRSCSCYFR